MRTRLAQLRYQWRRIPLRTRMGLLIAVVAIAGLAWQHYSSVETAAPGSDQQAAQEGEINHDGHDHDGHALGEYQPDPSELPPPPDFSPEAARVTAERFATNFASPNGNRDDWLARISPDVMPELLDQYRLTDIRNVPQATVAHVNGPMAADPAVPTFQIDLQRRIERRNDLGDGHRRLEGQQRRPRGQPRRSRRPGPVPRRPGTNRAGACAVGGHHDARVAATWRHSDRPDDTMTAPTRLSPRPAAAADRSGQGRLSDGTDGVGGDRPHAVGAPAQGLRRRGDAGAVRADRDAAGLRAVRRRRSFPGRGRADPAMPASAAIPRHQRRHRDVLRSRPGQQRQSRHRRRPADEDPRERDHRRAGHRAAGVRAAQPRQPECPCVTGHSA